jgi:hypothetical protein
MGKINTRYCVRAEKGKGWRIWDRKLNKFWGNPFKDYPTKILDLLNTGRKSEIKY